VEPSDHYKQGLGSGPSGGCGPTHSNGSPPEDGLLRSILENSDEVVKALDADGTLRYASPAFGRILGYDPEEAVGTMNVFDHVHPDDLPQVLAAIKGALSAGASPRTGPSTAYATPTARGAEWKASAPTCLTTRSSGAWL
jgi:PAS domain S-box-containing protein